MFVAIRGVIYSAGFVFLWTWLAITIQPYGARLPFVIPTWLRPAGFVLSSIGAVVAGWCIATFITSGRGTPAPFDPPVEFVAVGPYRYVRNPMYIGALSVIAGAGLALMSPSIVLLAFFFWLVTHLFVLIYEEPALERRFGSAYLNYKTSVRRWLPGFP